MSHDQLFFVRDRQLAYPVFDSDNHMYENTDAFTKFLPPQYEGQSVVRAYDGGTIGADSGHRSRHGGKSLSEKAFPATNVEDVATMFGGDSDQPRVVGGVVVPVVPIQESSPCAAPAASSFDSLGLGRDGVVSV